MAFFNTPGTDRLYSGVTKMTASTAATSVFRRLTGSAWLPSSSWLYRGRSSIRIREKEKWDGARRIRPSASLALNDSLRRLPTITPILSGFIAYLSGQVEQPCAIGTLLSIRQHQIGRAHV